jgi:3-deoxy-D-manno-octulosonic-acid transferase
VSTPFGLNAYRGLGAMVAPFARPLLAWRAAQGKEDSARLDERFGKASSPRPPGTLVWLHGASVGEARVLLMLARALADARGDLNFLITTGTTTSAEDIARAALPRAIHQYAPLDLSPAAARRFLEHWRPDLAVFAESELWPNMLLAAKQAGVPAALVNARMSAKSLANWARFRDSAARVLGCYDRIFAVDSATATGLAALTPTPVEAIGNLKLAAPAPKADDSLVAWLRGQIGMRPVWLAASTHAGEEEIAVSAHAILRRNAPDALLIIAPRHPVRGAAIAAPVAAPLRSRRQDIAGAAIYVADTIGELGALFAVASVTLMGGSLLPTLTGHNPIEPAKAGSAVLSGPHVQSFKDIYATLFAANAARETPDADAIAAAVDTLWLDPNARNAQTAAARAVLDGGGAALTRTIDALLALLSKGRTHAAA